MGGCILSALHRRSVRELGSIPLNASLFVMGKVEGVSPVASPSLYLVHGGNRDAGNTGNAGTSIRLVCFSLHCSLPLLPTPHPTPHPNLLVVSAILAHAHDADFCLFGNYDSAISFLPFLIADSQEIAFLKISCLFVCF